jgi:MOSC domain-containing protein YiiM
MPLARHSFTRDIEFCPFSVVVLRKGITMPLNLELIKSREFVGKVEWIGIATARRKDMDTPESIELLAGQGIVGEHHLGNQQRRHRQITLIQYEHLDVIARLLGRESVDPALLRRNVVVSGINLVSLREAEFSVGGVILQGTGDCDPCALMDHNLGAGGYAAMVSHCGITATVESSGSIVLGAEVRVRQFPTS